MQRQQQQQHAAVTHAHDAMMRSIEFDRVDRADRQLRRNAEEEYYADAVTDLKSRSYHDNYVHIAAPREKKSADAGGLEYVHQTHMHVNAKWRETNSPARVVLQTPIKPTPSAPIAIAAPEVTSSVLKTRVIKLPASEQKRIDEEIAARKRGAETTSASTGSGTDSAAKAASGVDSDNERAAADAVEDEAADHAAASELAVKGANKTIPLATLDAVKNRDRKVTEFHHVTIIRRIPEICNPAGALFDTGATDSLNKSAVGLTDVRKLSDDEKFDVLVGGKEAYREEAIGVGRDGIYDDVYVVPGLARDLRSSAQLMRQDHVIVLAGERCLVYGRADMALCASATLLDDNLIHVDHRVAGPSFRALADVLTTRPDPAPDIAHEASPVEALKPAAAPQLAAGKFGINPRLQHLTAKERLQGKARNRPAALREEVNERRVLHNRLGHINQQKIDNMCRNQTAIGICVEWEVLKDIAMGTCIACWLGKFKKFPAPRSLTQVPNRPMAIIRSDLKGPLKQSVHGSKYFQLNLCPTTSHLWISFHSSKKDTPRQYLQSLATVADKLNLRIEQLQSDSDTIYKDVKLRNWAAKEGIELFYTAPYRHEGSIEKWMDTVWTMLCTFLKDSGLPFKYWEEVAAAVVKILNSTPNTQFPKSCALTELRGIVPDISYFVPLGYPAVAKLYEEEPLHGGRGYRPRGVNCRVIGYAADTPGSYIIVTDSGKILTRKDVVVDENYTKNKPRYKVHGRRNGVLLLADSEEDEDEDNNSSKNCFNDNNNNSIAASVPPPRASMDDSNIEPRRTDQSTFVLRRSARAHEAPDRLMYTATAAEQRRRQETEFMRRRVSESRAADGALFERVRELHNAQREYAELRVHIPKSHPLPQTPERLADFMDDLSFPHRLELLRTTIKEMREMIDRGVVLDLRPGEVASPPPFKSKLAFRLTRQEATKLEDALKFKARLVACGYSSIFGVHYEQNYSPAVLFRSLLIIVHISKIEGWKKINLDVGNAYLEAEIKKPMYMKLPLDMTFNRELIVRLARNIYGLKDAGLLWYILIDKVLTDLGYTRALYDPCIYYRFLNKLERSIVALFVDDMACAGKYEAELQRIKREMEKRFKKITDLGELKKFLGINFTEFEDTGHLVLHQSEAINEYVAEYVKHGTAVKYVPLSPLVSANLDNIPGAVAGVRTATSGGAAADAMAGRERPPPEPDPATTSSERMNPIWTEVGKIRHLADRTRLELQYVASRLAHKQSGAPEAYHRAVADVFKYIAATKDIGLQLGGKDKVIRAFMYTDASEVKDRDSLSQLGWCIFLSRDAGAVIARSTKDKSVSLSSTESEIKALVEGVKDLIWLRGLLAELGYPQSEPSIVYQDNKSAIRICEKVGSESKTRHIINRINFVRQEVANNTIRLVYIPTEEMVADILTAARDRGPFEYLRNILLGGHWRFQKNIDKK